MAMEVVKSVELVSDSADTLSAVNGDGQMIAGDYDKADYNRLSETNDSAAAARVGDGSVEERFRVDRRKLEQLIQGRARRSWTRT